MAKPRNTKNAALDPLSEYAGKRNFALTPEPPAVVASRHGPLAFIVHEHAARRLHYDLRLELDGVLKCWAIPKGLLLETRAKHLAVPTEDHPLDYANFEGVIPPEQYGAGKVIVWDCGLYSPDDRGTYSFNDRQQAQSRVRKALEEGKLGLTLCGSKLKGSFALIRTAKGWLLIKHDDGVTPETRRAEFSPLSGETVASVSANVALVPHAFLFPTAPLEKMPVEVPVMTASAVDAPFNDAQWLFEPKLDGYRVTAYIVDGTAKIMSRGGKDISSHFPDLTSALACQPLQPLILDGELVAFENGRPSFSALQNRFSIGQGATAPVVFYCFDVLHAAGVNPRRTPYLHRRRFLQQCVTQRGPIQIVHADADGTKLFEVAVAAGLEGVIAKRKDSIYAEGTRSKSWLKIKRMHSGEFVIVGYTTEKRALSALLLAYYDGDTLRYAGRVGTGFDEATTDALLKRMQPRQSSAATINEKIKAIWVEPELVAEVGYYEVTKEGRLRHPVYLRLREDIEPRSVRAASAPEESAFNLAGPDLSHVLSQLNTLKEKGLLTIGDNRVAVTHLNKIFWPQYKRFKPLTKRDLLRYLIEASPYLLRFMRNRPVTLIRMPDGITGKSFFQKHLDQKKAPFVTTIAVPGNDGDDRKPLIFCNDLETLLWLGNLGAIEFHVWHSSCKTLADPIDADCLRDFDRPDYLAFDLDPFIYSGDEKAGEEPAFNMPAFKRCIQVACWLKEVLDGLRLKSFVKTTGKTGLHVFVPIRKTVSFEEAKRICELIGRHVVAAHPNEVTMEWSIARRTGKIFIDHNMNARGKTLHAAFSPRAQPGATFSIPVAWENLVGTDPTRFRLPSAANAFAKADPWHDFFALDQSLEHALGIE